MIEYDPERAVWITGVGLASPLGCDMATLEANLLAGRSGVSAVAGFPTDDYPSRIAASMASVPCPPSIEPAAFACLPRLEQAALWSVESALRDAGWWEHRGEGVRVGLVLGVGAEWLELWEVDRLAGGSRVQDPARDQETTVDRVRRTLGLMGPALTLSAACAASNFAFEVGRTWLRRGLADVCVVGGCEMAVTPVGLATFGNLRALSRRNDDPSGGVAPFRQGSRRLRAGRGRGSLRPGISGVRAAAGCPRVRRGRGIWRQQ